MKLYRNLRKESEDKDISVASQSYTSSVFGFGNRRATYSTYVCACDCQNHHLVQDSEFSKCVHCHRHAHRQSSNENKNMTWGDVNMGLCSPSQKKTFSKSAGHRSREMALEAKPQNVKLNHFHSGSKRKLVKQTTVL